MTRVAVAVQRLVGATLLIAGLAALVGFLVTHFAGLTGGVRVLHPMHNGVEVEEQRAHCDPPPLTPRQLEVLEMLAHGLRARTIARELHLAEATVRNHIRAIRRELGTHSQLEAVAAARRSGLVA